jgi:hypothetical protein
VTLYFLALVILSALSAATWLAVRRDAKRRQDAEDMAAVDAIFQEWKPKPRFRSCRTGRFQKRYATFQVRSIYDTFSETNPLHLRIINSCTNHGIETRIQKTRRS